MYNTILVALDGSCWSDAAIEAAIELTGAQENRPDGTKLIGCHVYAARMHRDRFQQMEPGLPQRYHEDGDRLDQLRGTHDSLISDGMKLISDAYLAPLEKRAREKGLDYAGLSVQGRNYVEILRVVRERGVDLLVMGAWGQGRVVETQLGGVAERALLLATESDILLTKCDWALKNRAIVVGIDGSPFSYVALERAATLGRAFGAPVEGVAVYDPFFHSGVFRSTTEALPKEAAERFNFPAQQLLHDEIIDHGLERLYRRGLERAISHARELGVEMCAEVLTGKVYPRLHQYAREREAGLVVVGRWGLHREPESPIGSNALNLARLCATNTLVVGSSKVIRKGLEFTNEAVETPKELSWTPEAEEQLRRIPFFVRRMARRAVENYVRERQLGVVTVEAVNEVARRFGMRK